MQSCVWVLSSLKSSVYEEAITIYFGFNFLFPTCIKRSHLEPKKRLAWKLFKALLNIQRRLFSITATFCISVDSKGKNKKTGNRTHCAVCKMWKTCFEFLNFCLFPLVLCLVFFCDSSMVPQAFPTSPLLRLLCCILLFQWHITEVITCTRFFLFFFHKRFFLSERFNCSASHFSHVTVHRGPSHLRSLLHFLSCWHMSAVKFNASCGHCVSFSYGDKSLNSSKSLCGGWLTLKKWESLDFK